MRFPFVKKKPAPTAETKPAPPTPLEAAVQLIAEIIAEADQRADRCLARLERRDRRSKTGTA